MTVDIPAIREIVERACTRQDVLDACKRRDLGAVITVLCSCGVTQGQLSVLTGITQGRLSEYKAHWRVPTARTIVNAARSEWTSVPGDESDLMATLVISMNHAGEPPDGREPGRLGPWSHGVSPLPASAGRGRAV